MTVGIDLVRVSRVAESLANFGERFLRRVFTEGEIAYATASPERAAERLAARFAAKEAAAKALGLVEHGNWRDIEVLRQPSGSCQLSLHGAARDAAAEAGVVALSVSMSHEGDYATAVVLAMRNQEAA
jgi:holo-[acyl-carrier protein] synthase